MASYFDNRDVHICTVYVISPVSLKGKANQRKERPTAMKIIIHYEIHFLHVIKTVKLFGGGLKCEHIWNKTNLKKRLLL